MYVSHVNVDDEKLEENCINIEKILHNAICILFLLGVCYAKIYPWILFGAFAFGGGSMEVQTARKYSRREIAFMGKF